MCRLDLHAVTHLLAWVYEFLVVHARFVNVCSSAHLGHSAFVALVTRPYDASALACRLQITSNLKNTITGMKAIMGKKFHSDMVQKEQELVGYNMVDVAGKIGIPVQYNDEEVILTPERAMSMLMKCMQNIAELDQGAPVTDVVVSVPSYFTDAERHAMLDAASIAGLNCLRLMNDITAAALSYGIYKTDMPADKVRRQQCMLRAFIP